MLITVFTPTYNRAQLLPRLYESLCQQSFTDFEWVIVDDGSTDDTEDVVRRIADKHSSGFHIRYIDKPNGGKHTAINLGALAAKGELFLILDSDDTLPADSLETISYYYNQIRGDKTFGGVCGYMAHHDGTVIGHGCDKDVIDTNSIDLRYKHHVVGDMCEVFRTSVLREFPFPEIEGEKFCPEALVWNRIATKYKLRVFKHVIYYRDYLDGGLTDKIVKIRMNSPIASMMTYAEMTEYDIPIKQKIKAVINYWRFRLCAHGDKIVAIKWYWHLFAPLGLLMHMNDKRTV